MKKICLSLSDEAALLRRAPLVDALGWNLLVQPLIQGQINLNKFIESNKFGTNYSKIWHIFVWANQLDQILKKKDVFYFIKLIW